MSKRPDLGLCVALSDEGIVLGGRAVRRNPQNLPHVAIELLRLRPDLDVGALPQCHIEHAILPEHQPRAEVVSAVVRRHGAEDHPHLLQSFAVG
jgi:hypothetical protein